ncbi:MAG TPA: hypothetical protein VHB46_04370 [Burkholderiales bacterium]|nr:hypothetical protein [Burkholderiales bacterium]
MPFMEQDARYHEFADTRSLWGMANATDTITNVAFLTVGVMGLAFLWREGRAATPRHFIVREEMRAYLILFLAVTLTAFGSAFYHLAPDNGRLVWDRLPMSLAFAALDAATVAERIRLSAGLRLLAPLTMLGAGSVAWWRLTGDLLPYAVAQFGSIGAILVIVMRFRSRYTHAGTMYAVLVCYALAKIAEACDARVYALGHIVSGHSLKHLLAAAAAWLVLDMLRKRHVDR